MDVDGFCSVRGSGLLDGRLHTFVNPYSYRVLREISPHALTGRDFSVHFDGISLVWLARISGMRRVDRISFDDTSIAPLVFSECVSRGFSIAFVGSTPGIAASAARHIKRRHSSLDVKFVSDGYYSINASADVLESAARCDVVICSMGTPRQENFLLELRALGWSGTGFTCGGYLDQLDGSGGDKYYPALIHKLQLRWLYRIWKEPKRLIPRYVIDYPVGMILFLMDRIRSRVSS